MGDAIQQMQSANRKLTQRSKVLEQKRIQPTLNKVSEVS